jgi:hypothetical protein
MMQGDVSVAAAQPRQEGRQKTGEGNQGISPKGAEQQIEPDYIRFQSSECPQKPDRTRRIIEGPAAENRKAVEFRLPRRDLIGEHREAEKGVAAKLLSNVQTVLTQPALTRRKSGYQTYFHSFPSLTLQLR